MHIWIPSNEPKSVKCEEFNEYCSSYKYFELVLFSYISIVILILVNFFEI